MGCIYSRPLIICYIVNNESFKVKKKLYASLNDIEPCSDIEQVVVTIGNTITYVSMPGHLKCHPCDYMLTVEQIIKLLYKIYHIKYVFPKPDNMWVLIQLKEYLSSIIITLENSRKKRTMGHCDVCFEEYTILYPLQCCKMQICLDCQKQCFHNGRFRCTYCQRYIRA